MKTKGRTYKCTYCGYIMNESDVVVEMTKYRMPIRRCFKCGNGVKIYAASWASKAAEDSGMYAQAILDTSSQQRLIHAFQTGDYSELSDSERQQVLSGNLTGSSDMIVDDLDGVIEIEM